MKLFLHTLLALALWLTGNPLWASGIETNGVGARATAMGGSYRAIANDWSAMYWNPAGLAFTPGWNAGVFGAVVMPRATFKAGSSHYYNLYGGEEFKPFSVAYPSERSNEPQTFVLPGFGVSYNTGTWAFGLSVFVPMGWGAKWDVLHTQRSSNDTPPYEGYNTAYPEIEYESDIRIIDIHPTVAYKINNQLSLGVGASLIVGNIAIRQPAFLQNPYLYERTLYRTLQSISEPSAIQTLSEMRKPPFDHLITQAQMNSSGTTVGANIGVLFKPSPDWSFGASIQYYGDLDPSGDYDQTTFFADAPFYDAQAQAFTDSLFRKLYQAGLLDDEQFQIVSEFYSGNVDPRIDTKAQVSVPLPLKAGVGISYSGIQNLLLALDVNVTQWSVWDILTISDTDGTPLSELLQNWNNTFKVGMGMEYTRNRLKLRAGFGYESRAAVDESVSPTIPDIGDRYNLNLGIAAPVGPVQVSLNYEHIFISDHEITQWVYDDMFVTQNIAGVYTMNANSIMIGIDYGF